MENVKAMAVLAAIILAAVIATIVVLPIRVAFMNLQEENAALRVKLADYELCTLHTVVCDFEKDVEFGD